MSNEALHAYKIHFTVGLPPMLLAMWMDIQDNERLHK